MYLNEDIWYIQWLYYLIDVWIYIYIYIRRCLNVLLEFIWTYVDPPSAHSNGSNSPNQLVQGARRVRAFLHGFGSSLVMRLCEGFSDGFQVPKSWPGCWFQTFLIFHNTWGVIRNPLTNSIIFQDGYCTTNQWPLLISSFLNLSPPRTQFWNLLSSHSMSAFSLVHGQCLAVQLTILPEQSCLGCWYALDMCLVGGLEHGFYSPIIYGIILPPLTFIFFRGVGIPPTRCRL